jgi:hypothetical protein
LSRRATLVVPKHRLLSGLMDLFLTLLEMHTLLYKSEVREGNRVSVWHGLNFLSQSDYRARRQ